MRRSKIAFLTSWSSDPVRGSGTAMAINLLRKGLSALGQEVQIVGGLHKTPFSLLGRLSYNFRIRSSLRDCDFDLLVGFDMDGFLLPKRTRAPYLVSLKGISADEERFESGAAAWKLYFLSRLERMNVRRAERLVVTSRYCEEVVRKVYAVEAKPIHVVPEGIDLDGWEKMRNEENLPKRSRPTILNVARQYPRKDTETLLRAAAVLLEEFPNFQVRIVGEGPHLPRLEKLVRTLDLESHVKFLGTLERESLMQEYFRAHVFCLPSRQEGFGIVFLEAMAAGLPIVAARAGAIPEVVGEGEVGKLFTPGDERELAASLQALLEDRGCRDRLSRAAVEEVRRYDYRKTARQFVEVLHRLREME